MRRAAVSFFLARPSDLPSSKPGPRFARPRLRRGVLSPRATRASTRRSPAAAGLVAAGALFLAASCGGGLKTVGKDGYRAILSFSKDERFEVAVRGEWKRVEARMEGAPLIKVVRPDRKQVWQFRPTTKRIMESAWQPTEEIVPGYPLEPDFDPYAYADRFGGSIKRIGDDAHGLHPCDRWRMSLPSGDVATLWVARDLEKLVVRIEHAKKDQSDEYQPFTTTELLDVRIGANPDLFEMPKGYTPVRTYQDLLKP